MKTFTKLLTIALLTTALVTPSTAFAQKRQTRREIERRQKTKSDWQKLGYAGAALGLLGQLGKDKTLSYVGTAGALYSLYRFNEDSKSQNKTRRERAEFYGRESYTRKGVRYERKIVTRHGRTYYTFVPVH